MAASRIVGGRSPVWLGPVLVAAGTVAWGGAGAAAHSEPAPTEREVVEQSKTADVPAPPDETVVILDDAPEPPTTAPQPPVNAAAPEPCAPSVELTFGAGQSDLDWATSLETLEGAANEFPDRKIVVEGYASAEGSARANLQLSHKRAKQAKRKLVAHGIDAARITVQAYGEYRPNLDGDVERDRRVVVKIEGVATCLDQDAEE